MQVWNNLLRRIRVFLTVHRGTDFSFYICGFNYTPQQKMFLVEVTSHLSLRNVEVILNRCSPEHRPPLPPGNISVTHFC
jgi:hypothetical protein